MNHEDPNAAAVWSHTLASLRREKRRRRTSLAVLTPVALALIGIMIFRKDPVAPAAPAATTVEQPAPPFAIVVVRDGFPTLEAISADELGNTELHLSLEPILADFRDLPGEGL